jgi:hypothetical protein
MFTGWKKVDMISTKNQPKILVCKEWANMKTMISEDSLMKRLDIKTNIQGRRCPTWTMVLISPNSTSRLKFDDHEGTENAGGPILVQHELLLWNSSYLARILRRSDMSEREAILIDLTKGANAWLGVSLLAPADSLESISFFAYKVESFLFFL